MNLDKYDCLPNEEYTSFTFESIGPRGVKKKLVTYTQIRASPEGMPVFNLGFGDWDEKRKRIDDSIASNNDDRDKVLATVASTIFTFVSKYGKCAIYAEGSSPVKTRLYQMGINAHWGEVSQWFYVFGLLKGKWYEFASGRNFEAFLVIMK